MEEREEDKRRRKTVAYHINFIKMFRQCDQICCELSGQRDFENIGERAGSCLYHRSTNLQLKKKKDHVEAFPPTSPSASSWLQPAVTSRSFSSNLGLKCEDQTVIISAVGVGVGGQR